MKEQLIKILSRNFFFDPIPPVQSDYYLPLLIVFFAVLILGLAIAILVRGEMRKFFKGYITPLLSAGILGNLHLFARYESLPWISSRIFLAMVISLSLIWLLILSFIMLNRAKKYVTEKSAEDRYNKYLPKSKRK